MFGKSQDNQGTRFAVRPGHQAARVDVAGDFSNWQPVPMERQEDGLFVRVVATPKTDFEYKFIVDGEWIPDPDNPYIIGNAYGSFNSVAPQDASGAMYGWTVRSRRGALAQRTRGRLVPHPSKQGTDTQRSPHKERK